MRFTKRDLVCSEKGTIQIDEHLAFKRIERLHHTQVKSIPEVHVTGILQFDGNALVFSDLHLDGVMIVPDSITSEDLEVTFDTRSQTTYSFVRLDDETDDEIIVAKQDTIDLNPEIFQTILLEAPISITNLPRDQYPKGNGWQLLSDSDQPDDEDIDPRWEKLNEFKMDDD